jgi:O-succinylbenzoate synthase
MKLPTEIFRDFTVLQIPLRQRFRGIDYREVALFHGDAGWSEFSPFLEYDANESRPWLKASLAAAYKPWPAQFRSEIPINATLPIVPVDQVARVLARFTGCTTVKIKVDDFDIGAGLVEETLNIIPHAKIRLDVNGGWDLAQTRRYIGQYLERFGEVFEYIEQPSHSLEDLQALKRDGSVKIAVDEAIRKNLSASMESLRSAADIAILKWQPVGGFEAAHSLADRIGLPVVVSSALETGIGISHNLALAASFKELDYACGLGTTSLFESDICEPPVVAKNGLLEVKRVVPDPELLKKYQAAPERVEWWSNRVTEIFESEGFREELV